MFKGAKAMTNSFTKAEALSAIHLIQTAQINAQGYCDNKEDVPAATMAALKTAIKFAEHGIPKGIVESLTYREPK